MEVLEVLAEINVAAKRRVHRVPLHVSAHIRKLQMHINKLMELLQRTVSNMTRSKLEMEHERGLRGFRQRVSRSNCVRQPKTDVEAVPQTPSSGMPNRSDEDMERVFAPSAESLANITTLTTQIRMLQEQMSAMTLITAPAKKGAAAAAALSVMFGNAEPESSESKTCEEQTVVTSKSIVATSSIPDAPPLIRIPDAPQLSKVPAALEAVAIEKGASSAEAKSESDVSSSSPPSSSSLSSSPLSSSSSSEAEVAEAAAAAASPSNPLADLKSAIANMQNRTTGKSTKPRSPQARPRKDNSLGEQLKQVKLRKAQVPTKKVFTRNIPGSESLSFSQLVKVSSRIALRKTNIPRSPGGTPLMRASRPKNHFLMDALLKKFRNARGSVSPTQGARVASWRRSLAHSRNDSICTDVDPSEWEDDKVGEIDKENSVRSDT